MTRISREAKETLMGGAVAGAIVGFEGGMNWFVAGYPQVLKDKLISYLPRNGALLANVLPAGVSYAMTRKRGSARAKNMRTGILLYDIPKLLGQVVYNTAYEMGRPSASMRMGIPRTNLRIASRTPTATAAPRATASVGKYTLKTDGTVTPKTALGRYR